MNLLTATQTDSINGKGQQPLLSKTAAVFEVTDYLPSRADAKTFVYQDADNPDTYRVLEIEGATWDDLGQPQVLTITIEPGDRLNS